jgi:hypothetical protein
MSDAGNVLAEVKQRFAEISETWFHFHFFFNVIKHLQSFVSSIRVFMDLRNQYSPQPKGFGEYRF